ncbi:MAG: methyltransferase domain-containing protein [Candidatus Moraniibacteriota bacterium]
MKKIALNCDYTKKKILDIGAWDCPYKKFFKKATYYSQDIVQNNNKTIDYVCDISLGLVGVEDESFDYILCTQVLEHLRKPYVAFQEFSRVLKPGEKIFLTTHQCFEEHMIPDDYFRFTRYGLKALGEASGLKLVHLAPHGGIFQILALILSTLPIKLFLKEGSFWYFAYLIVFFIPIFLFNSLCLLLDFLDRKKTMTLNFECIYEKK